MEKLSMLLILLTVKCLNGPKGLAPLSSVLVHLTCRYKNILATSNSVPL